MSRPRFFCDEDVDPDLIRGLLALEPTIDISRVGQPGAPPLGSSDPDLLLFKEAQGRAFLTLDVGTMRQHVVNHWRTGHHTWGVFFLNPNSSFGRLIAEIMLIWGASEADEWIDWMEFLPL